MTEQQPEPLDNPAAPDVDLDAPPQNPDDPGPFVEQDPDVGEVDPEAVEGAADDDAEDDGEAEADEAPAEH